MTAKQRYLQFMLTVPILFLAYGCKRGDDRSSVPSSSAPPAEAGIQGKTEARPNNAVVVLERGRMSIIKIERWSEKVLPSTLIATGKVNFNEDQMARILAPVPGQVIHLQARVGDSVAKGQPLFYINSRDVAAAISEHLENRKDLELAEKNYALTKDLYEHQAASQVSLQQADSDLAKAKARAARSQNVLQVLGLNANDPGVESRIPVRAPLNGKVVERSVTEGQFVQADSNALMV